MLVLVGLSHKTAPVEVRERVHFPRRSLEQALAALLRTGGVLEGLILSTCNRVEVLARADEGADGASSLKAFLHDYHDLPPRALEPYLYSYVGRDAVRHLFRVASSLDSLVVGEPQILGQVKEAYSAAARAGAAGSYLSALMHSAFRAAKRVRSETAIGETAVSISYAAVELAKKIFGSLSGKTVLIIGAGKMSELATKHFKRSGVPRVLVSNRTFEKACELAALFDGEPVRFEELQSWLPLADIIIASTGSPGFIITRSDAQRLVERRNKPLFFIDISVPRNVDPEVNSIENAFCYDIDDLGSVVEANRRERMREALLAEKLIEEEVIAFERRLASLDLGPVIAALKRKIEGICSSELERYLKKAAPASAEQRRELDQMVGRIANKVAHLLIARMKDSDGTEHERASYIESIKRAFDL